MEKKLIPFINKAFSVAISIIILLSVGCAAPKPQANRNRVSLSVTDGTLRTYKREGPYAQNPLVPNADTSGSVVEPRSRQRKIIRSADRAKKIALEIVKIDGVLRASVVVSDRTALIGIETVSDTDSSSLMKIRSEAEKSAMQADPDIEHAAVTASPELVERITEMSDCVIADEDTLQWYND